MITIPDNYFKEKKENKFTPDFVKVPKSKERNQSKSSF